ncbi:MAG: inositol monophosphatase [Thermodesulfovibrionales bacterium]|nr:inositol monophosphatase [Thermodesulfovibrionales bacterium]
MNLEKILIKLLEKTYQAGDLLKFYYSRGSEVTHKGTIDLVTEADLEVEAFLKRELSTIFPEISILAEESHSDWSFLSSQELFFCIDPLDGTTNFAHGLPWFAISIALLRGNEPLAGIVYNPVKEELFYAIRGGGAFFNHKRIQVSERSPLINCLLATGFPVSKIMEKPEYFFKPFEEFMIRTRGIRRFGSAALDLAYVAAGKYDGFFEAYLKPWDTAAGILLVQEAKGKVTDYHGNPFNLFKHTIIASNALIHDEMVEILKNRDPENFKPF